ncbi:uncharacterized protein [Mycetomoellerius zeteki]|uniref:uncharacterized protein n=1 Tax=Mycetomoellerius zeteki TaxID=64791 RepID=UPI00084E9640|nr:PREDICTED: uncharacterized protein LOC108726981 [Trachymyrmex zeteki]
MVHYVMKVVLIVWACETGKNQAREISTTIYDVLNNTRDEQIKGELQLFSLQILHCKNIFLTKGLAMDATLLVAMVGGITTYVLILIQFLIAAHSCDETFGISITNNSENLGNLFKTFTVKNLSEVIQINPYQGRLECHLDSRARIPVFL